MTIRARSSTWTLDGGTNGIFKGTIHPHIEDITLEISAPGYKPERLKFNLNELQNGRIALEPIVLEQQVTAIVGSMDNILAVDTSEEIDSISAMPSFGGAP